MKAISSLAALLCLIFLQPVAAEEAIEPPEIPQTFDKVMVWVLGLEREYQIEIEQSVVEKFAKKDITAIAMTTLAPDERYYGRDEIERLMKAQRIAVVFELAGAGERGMQNARTGFTDTVVRSDTGADSGIGPNQGGGGTPVMMVGSTK